MTHTGLLMEGIGSISWWVTGAAASGHTEIVAWLLTEGADVNHRYGPGYWPFLAAAANSHLEIVKMLLEHGADPLRESK